MRHPRTCLLAIAASAVCSCTGTMVFVRWTGTHTMTVDEALWRLEVMGPSLTDAQRKVLASTLGQHALASVAALRRLAADSGPVGVEAATQLLHVEDALR